MGYHTYVSYPLKAYIAQKDFLDSTTYYLGSTNNASTTGAENKVYVPRSGTVRKVILFWYHVTQNCTTENVTFYIRKNLTTDSSAVYTGSLANAASPASITNLNFSVSEGDYIHLKVNTPAWVTNPTGTYIDAIIEIQV